MAEIWPRLKRKLACDHVRRRKKSSKASAASSRLEKLAALLKGVHSKSKASSLVERTGASVSAARSLSRSAQEWTASTLARTASRREGSKSPEVVLLQCAVAQTRSSEYTERLSCAEARFNSSSGVGVEKSKAESRDTVCEASVVRSVEQDVGNLSDDRQSQPGEREAAIALPLRRSGRCMKKIRSLQRTSTSAFVVLVALGAFISSRFGKVGNPLAAALTFNAVVLRVCRRGKLYARVVFSSIALYFLVPLRSYLTYCPRRLSVGKLTDSRTHLASDELSRNLESSLVVPLEPSVASVAPLSLLLIVPETPASLATEPAASGDSSPSRRLAKKVSSRLKKLKMFSSSSSSPSRASSSALSSSCSHSTASSEPASPVSASNSRKCPFSRRLHKSKSEIPPDFADEESKKSRLSRMSSSETLDIGEITAIACSDVTPTRLPPSEEAISWPMVGLLVTLLFLLVGRVPAIVATSLFLVVVSNAHHGRAHPRSRRASEAARKLHRNQQPGSPPRRH